MRKILQALQTCINNAEDQSDVFGGITAWSIVCESVVINIISDPMSKNQLFLKKQYYNCCILSIPHICLFVQQDTREHK